MKKNFFILLIFFLYPLPSYAENAAMQVVRAANPEVLHIEKIIVEGKEFEKDDFIDCVQIRGIERLSDDCYRLNLSPFSIRINTNLSDPVQVSAKFESCQSACGRYPLENNDLSVEPENYTIENPYNGVETDFFTPKILAHDYTVCTTYNAHLVITLGRV